jgi:alkanesulfonate monooxygenase SsuD/methylene tetrahydromethanopterin reductase-like flavin-dependent oxidoreductase (luciferase family)
MGSGNLKEGMAVRLARFAWPLVVDAPAVERRDEHLSRRVRQFRKRPRLPQPVRGADLPIFFGGESGPALRRVAEYGNGWIGFNLTPDEAAAKIRRIEELLKANGRKRSNVELAISNSGKPITPDALKHYRDAGVEEFVITSRL